MDFFYFSGHNGHVLKNEASRNVNVKIFKIARTVQYNTIQWKICTQKLTNKCILCRNMYLGSRLNNRLTNA